METFAEEWVFDSLVFAVLSLIPVFWDIFVFLWKAGEFIHTSKDTVSY